MKRVADALGDTMATRKKKILTRAGRQIIAGLTELVDAARRGDDLSQRFTVRRVKLPKVDSTNKLGGTTNSIR
jgi:hypothetical protein